MAQKLYRPKKRGRPKTGRPSLDLGTPETRRYRTALSLTIKKQDKRPLPPLSCPVDILYNRGRLSKKAWESALKIHRLWSRARGIVGAPRPLTATWDRPNGRSCALFSDEMDQKNLNRLRVIMADVTAQSPKAMGNIYHLLYRADPLDYPYLSPPDLQETSAILESVSV